MNRNKPKTIGKHGEVGEKTLYKCISEGLMHVAPWYHGTPDQCSGNSGNKASIGQTPNAAKFRCTPTKSARAIPCGKFLLPRKVSQSSPYRSPDLSPVDRPYASFYRHCVVTLALDCFVLEISLVLYHKYHFCTYSLRLSPKLWRCSPRVRSMSSITQ